MTAWVVPALGEPGDVLALREMSVPSPAHDQVLVRVRGAALGFPDVLLCRGAYQVRPELPFVPGAEVCGLVVDTGGAAELSVGDRVAAVLRQGVGGLAEYAVADRQQVYAVPDVMTDTEAAALSSSYLTAWLGLHRRARLQPGETLVVSAAAGGVGSAAVQIGLAAGARVIAITRGPVKVEVAKSVGADVVIDSLCEPITEAVRRVTAGRGADVVFDPVGGETYTALARSLAFGGRVLVVGFAGGEIQTARLNRALLGGYSIVGVNVARHVTSEPHVVRDAMTEIVGFVAEGRLRPLVGAVKPMQDAAAQLQTVADGRSIGRVVITPPRTT